MKKVIFLSCIREADVKGMNKNEEKKFVGQRLGVTPRSWLSPKGWLLSCNVVVFQSFSTRATYAHDAKSSLKSKGVIISKQIQYQQLLYIYRCYIRQRTYFFHQLKITLFPESV